MPGQKWDHIIRAQFSSVSSKNIFNLNLQFFTDFHFTKKNLPTGEVIFNVLGFAEHHNEDFLESLALIGTSDGSYSFVSPKEGKMDTYVFKFDFFFSFFF